MPLRYTITTLAIFCALLASCSSPSAYYSSSGSASPQKAIRGFYSSIARDGIYEAVSFVDPRERSAFISNRGYMAIDYKNIRTSKLGIHFLLSSGKLVLFALTGTFCITHQGCSSNWSTQVDDISYLAYATKSGGLWYVTWPLAKKNTFVHGQQFRYPLATKPDL